MVKGLLSMKIQDIICGVPTLNLEKSKFRITAQRMDKIFPVLSKILQENVNFCVINCSTTNWIDILLKIFIYLMKKT